MPPSLPYQQQSMNPREMKRPKRSFITGKEFQVVQSVDSFIVEQVFSLDSAFGSHGEMFQDRRFRRAPDGSPTIKVGNSTEVWADCKDSQVTLKLDDAQGFQGSISLRSIADDAAEACEVERQIDGEEGLEMSLSRDACQGMDDIYSVPLVGSRECVGRPERSILARAPHVQSYNAHGTKVLHGTRLPPGGTGSLQVSLPETSPNLRQSIATPKKSSWLLDGNAKHHHVGQDSRPKWKRATGSRPRLARPATPHHFLLLLIMMMTLMLVCCMMTTTNAAPNPNPEAAVGVIATAAGMAGKAIDLITVVGEMISPLPKSEPEIEPDPYPHHLDDSDDEEILPHDKEPKSPAGPASSAIEPMNPVMKMSAFRKFLMSVMEKFDAGLDPDAAAKKLKEEFVKSQDDTKSSLSLMPLESGVAVSSSSSNSQRPGRDSRTNLAPAKPSDNLMQQQLQASKVLAADYAKRQLTSPDGETNAVCGEHHDNCVVDCKVVCEPDSVNILVK
ncbi:unnamed protein product, partial [Notodromas monacha]